MKKQQELMLVLALVGVLIPAGLFLPGLVGAGDLEPSGPPGPTMKTLDQMPPTWSQILPASERFEDVMGGDAVLDRETGLVWAKDANLYGYVDWHAAYHYPRTSCKIGGRKGWRLPTVEELSSLLDMSQPEVYKVPPGVFNNVRDAYWSITIDEHDSSMAWLVWMGMGVVGHGSTDSNAYVWPVRGGNR